jgi:hypothetical protein
MVLMSYLNSELVHVDVGHGAAGGATWKTGTGVGVVGGDGNEDDVRERRENVSEQSEVAQSGARLRELPAHVLGVRDAVVGGGAGGSERVCVREER